MTGRVLVLGGYGNFGKRIVRALIGHAIPVIIAGRSRENAEAFLRTLPAPLAAVAVLDVTRDFAGGLQAWRPAVVINTCGPFQTSNYDVACLCVEQGVHYIDLADGREFVTGITALDAQAKAHGVAVISGASTVPGLSSAVLEHYAKEFSYIDSLAFGISPGQKAERGLATTQSIMTYVGRPLKSFAGSRVPVYGWGDIYRQDYPELGKRWMANCDIPDLNLLPARYGIGAIRFSAGLELGFMHLGVALLSWLVRIGIPLNLPRHAAMLLRMSNIFNGLGTANGGMHMIIRGSDAAGKSFERRWFIIAKNGDGPQIPCVPAIVLAKRIMSGAPVDKGAYPCVGLVSLEEYMRQLDGFNVRQVTQCVTG